MNHTVTALLLAIGLVAALAVLASRFSELQRSYYFGIAAWSRWLPVVGVGIYLALIGVNLLIGPSAGPHLSFGPAFSTLELMVFFCVGPLLLTRMGNVLGTATVLYFIERLISGARGGEAPLSLLMLTGATTTVAMLADKMPWLSAQGPSATAHRFREVLMTFLTVAAMGVVFVAITRVGALGRWMAVTIGVNLPNPLNLALLAAIFVGWLTVAIGFTRHFTIPLLCLPSLFVVAFVTSWPAYLLVIPFTMCISLALATGDRRTARRRNAPVAATVYIGR